MLTINRLYGMDCLKGLCKINDRSIDLIVCDLPYGITANAWDSPIDLEEFWLHLTRVCKTSGAVILTACQPFTSTLVMSNRKWFRHEWIWDKRAATGHLNAKRMPMRRHESILVFSECAPPYKPLGIQIMAGHRRRASKRSSNYGSADRATDQSFTGYPNSILAVGRDREKLHPTQKPVALFEYLIRTYSSEGALVLDCCMGSGTTAIACINSGRDYIGFELNREYLAAARSRIRRHSHSCSRR